MLNLGADGQQIARELAAATGLPATTDPRDVQLPGVLIVPAQVTLDRLDAATATVEWSVTVLGTGAPLPDALDTLGAALIELTTQRVWPMPGPWEATSVTLPDKAINAPIPGFQTTLTTESE